MIREGSQCVTGKNKEGSGCRVIWCFCSTVFLADLSCLATGCLGLIPTQQTRTLHLLPYRLEINCLDLGKLLCNPEN